MHEKKKKNFFSVRKLYVLCFLSDIIFQAIIRKQIKTQEKNYCVKNFMRQRKNERRGNFADLRFH